MAHKYTIVLVDDEFSNIESLERILRSESTNIITFQDPQLALRFIQKESADLVLTDVKMGNLSGIDLLSAIKIADPSIEVVLLTAFGTVELAVEAMKKGAYDFITKPLQRIQVLKVVERAIERRRLVHENTILKEELSGHSSLELIGRSEPMKRMMEVVNQAADSQANVLIQGESGTGKGVLAEYIHRKSALSTGLFVKINCTAIPENLLEAELFGYEPGAFTGAVKRKKGRLELAHGGTLFLDEIGITPVTFQSKLLRFLQEGEFERLGSNETHKVETRVISATNANLKQAIQMGLFREDLFYRLNVIGITVPTLRERNEDIPLLAKKFLEDAARKNRREVPLIHPEALDAIVRYAWPGNIRELQNLIERLVVLTKTGFIEYEDLPAELVEKQGQRLLSLPVGIPLKEAEKLLMEETLKATKGDKKLAAKLLGIHPRTIYRFLESVDESEVAIENRPV